MRKILGFSVKSLTPHLVVSYRWVAASALVSVIFAALASVTGGSEHDMIKVFETSMFWLGVWAPAVHGFVKACTGIDIKAEVIESFC